MTTVTHATAAVGSDSGDDKISKDAWEEDHNITAPGTAAYKRTSADYTTTSTSFVDIDGTNMALTITTGARRVLIGFIGSWYNSGANTMALDFTVDGTRVGGDFGLMAWNINHAGNAIPVSATFLTDVLSAGSHTFKVQWKVSGGTGTMQGATASAHCQFYVTEQG